MVPTEPADDQRQKLTNPVQENRSPADIPLTVVVPMTRCRSFRASVRSARPRIDHEDGFSLIELMVAMGVALLLLAIVPRVIQSVADANSYAQGVTAGSAALANVVQELEPRVESASQICLPTQLTTAGPTITSGYGFRVLSEAFGQTLWDQWWLNTTTGVLAVQVWPTNWVVGNAVPAWNPIATSIINTSTAPFSLPTVPTGSPRSSRLTCRVTEHPDTGLRRSNSSLRSQLSTLRTRRVRQSVVLQLQRKKDGHESLIPISTW